MVDVIQLKEEFAKHNMQIETIKSKLEEDILQPLIKKRKELEVKAKPLKEEIKAISEEISIIDAEIETHLKDMNLEEYNSNGYKFVFTENIVGKVIEMERFLNWLVISKEFDILRADFIKKKSITTMVDQGVCPDGVKISTYKKFEVKGGKDNG